jgi:hypothetical protein
MLIMVTSDKASALAEAAIAQYAQACGLSNPEEVRKALEMLISKAARGIEKYAGTDVAVDVLKRTTLAIEPAASASMN